MLKFPSIDKAHGGGIWRAGPDTAIDPRHVIAIEPREHRYSLDFAGQVYSVVHLSTGAVIEVMVTSGGVQAAVLMAMAGAVFVRTEQIDPATEAGRGI